MYMFYLSVTGGIIPSTQTYALHLCFQVALRKTFLCNYSCLLMHSFVGVAGVMCIG